MLNATVDVYPQSVAVYPLNETTSDHQPLDVTALRRACQGSMADVLSGDLQSQPLQVILTAMRSVQEADNALDFLIEEYLKMQGADKTPRSIPKVGRLVRCAANFLLEEFEAAGSLHGKDKWSHSCLSELLRLCTRIEPCGSAHTLFTLQASVLRQKTPPLA